MRIEWTGTRNAASTGTGIGVDALDVVGVLSPDMTAPTSAGSADAAWSKTPATVTLSAEDAHTWVTAIRYSVDGGAETTDSAPFTVTPEGEHSIAYFAIDAAGNAEAPKTLTVKNDTTTPVTTATAPAGWVADSATVSLSAQDSASGVTETLYSTDGSDPSIPYSAPVTIETEGVHTVKYRSKDAAGNTEAPGSVTVRVDVAAPVVSASAPEGWLNAPYTLSIQATDTASGVERITYGIGAEPTIETSGVVLAAVDGVHTVYFAAQDAVGHTGSTGSATVRIDTERASSPRQTPWRTTRLGRHLPCSGQTTRLRRGSGTEYSLDGAVVVRDGTSTRTSCGRHLNAALPLA